jgi:hypothetical protein
MNNRDVYLAINELRADASQRTLEEYLRALFGLCRPLGGVDSLSAEQFVTLLADALRVEPVTCELASAAFKSGGPADPGSYRAFERTLLRQIVDLREMSDAGILSRDFIELGVDAPRGGRWFNFTVASYLECAAAGCLGGWEPGDATGRSFVPGQVVVQDAAGELTSVDPQNVPREVQDLERVTWERFEEFLFCGQMYE